MNSDNYLFISREALNGITGELRNAHRLLHESSQSNSQLVVSRRNTENNLARYQSENSALQARNYSLESEKSNLQNLINAGERELVTKNNQIATYSSQVTTAQNQYRESQNQLVATQNQLAVKNNAFNDLQIVSNNKDNELEKRTNKIKELKEMLGKSQEEVLNHRLDIKEGKLETLIQQLGINRDRILTLRNTYQDLIRARENYNQGNINTANNSIEQIKGGFLNGGVNVENMQKICRKTEKIAKLKIEQEKLYQEQFEARQVQAAIPHNN